MFIQYMLSFYGPKGVYPELNFSSFECKVGTLVYMERLKENGGEFCGDSVDREAVRDIVMDIRNGRLEEFSTGTKEFV